MTWLLAECCQLFAVFLSIRNTFKTLQNFYSQHYYNKNIIKNENDATIILKFWVLFAFLRIFEYYIEYFVRWYFIIIFYLFNKFIQNNIYIYVYYK